MRYSLFALLLLLACKHTRSEPYPGDASPPLGAADAANADGGAPATATASASAAAADADASRARGDGELTLDVTGGYCPAERRGRPECRSYSYSLRTDGTLRGGKRTTAVPAADVDALFDLALDAFSAKHDCIPNAPDRGGQSITLRWNGTRQTARGGCGARIQEVQTRLEMLASKD